MAKCIADAILFAVAWMLGRVDYLYFVHSIHGTDGPYSKDSAERYAKWLNSKEAINSLYPVGRNAIITRKWYVR
jgi:hypothetical protein